MTRRYFWLTILAAVLSGLVIAAILKMFGALRWTGTLLLSPIPVPTWLLITLILLPSLAVALLLRRRSHLSKAPPPTLVSEPEPVFDPDPDPEFEYGLPDPDPDPIHEYTTDALEGAIWAWRFDRNLDEKYVRDLKSRCPRTDCRTDLQLGFPPTNDLRCPRCGYKARSAAWGIEGTVRREIVSRARTGDWTRAAERIRELEQDAGSK
jgi:hypothetical protein